MNCKNCKYWTRVSYPEKGEIIYKKHGVCSNDKTHEDLIPVYEEGSDCEFMENFGCIHFEKK